MSLAIQPGKTTRIRAAAHGHPDLDPRELARRLGVLTSDVRTALGKDPKPRAGRRAGAK